MDDAPRALSSDSHCFFSFLDEATRDRRKVCWPKGELAMSVRVGLSVAFLGMLCTERREMGIGWCTTTNCDPYMRVCIK